jgi:sulfoxide reductase heme-binding subunit YedZ
VSGRLAALARSRLAVAAALIAPLVWPAVTLGLVGNPSALADPPKYLLLHLGFTASVLLATVLALTPLRVIFPKWDVARALQRHRRWIGVSAFLYAVLHVTMHFIYEGGFGTFVTDWRKPFILVGITAFSILAILAGTSSQWAIRRLGGRWWKRLHRLAYVAAALVVYHQISAKKVFPMEVLWIFGPLFVLEILRVVRGWTPRARVAGG